MSKSYWHSRGYLPHFESPEEIQHLTLHLSDSLPQEVLRRIKEDMARVPTANQTIEKRRQLEAYLDAGYGCCVLAQPAVARRVQDALLYFHGQRCHILAWVVMPNHLHVLFQPLPGWTVKQLVASWKKFTARQIRDYQRQSSRSGGGGVLEPIWHREFFDRYVRSERHYWRVVDYIHNNPVASGLVKYADEWPWSSIHRAEGMKE